ncbi:hypothetical protein [Opitutus sp. GAS368]|jgi:hypothetical protein|uniref:hypothetical protein n=1 Tax=Opitutus sp. GAS368 TaxID=1882749 RepID=UPI00087AB5A9|nr:hypothetical protein [Opitutus sp. GAS368]SDS62447.1 hypothetical protein SAMN05444173_3458 [Opitutus sp. GAS368]
MSAADHRPTPKPWPMKWVAVAIVVFVVGYTVVNFYFRKPGRAYRPYQDAQDRATTARLLAAGWQKMPVDARRPVEKPAADDTPAAVTRAALGLGPDLTANFAEQPKLLTTIDRVVAPASVAHGADYNAYFTASISSQKAQVGDLALYRKGTELVLIPSTEPLPGKDLMSRWSDSTYCVNFSTANLPPGRYQVRIVAQGPALAWSFTVK